MKYSDEEWMLQFQKGDSAGLEHLFEKYRKPLYLFIFRQSKDEQLSIDIVQDVFLKLQQMKFYFNPQKGKFKTYLFQIAYNTLKTKWKRKSKWRQLLPMLTEESQSHSVSTDERLDVATAVDALPVEQRAVILLYYYHDLSQKEIAEILNIPLGTVKSRHYTAIKKLRQDWRLLGDEER